MNGALTERLISKKTWGTTGGFTLVALIASGAMTPPEVIQYGSVGLAGGGIAAIALVDSIKAWRGTSDN